MKILGKEINASEEQILGFAISKGYEPTKTVDITEEMTVEQASEKGYNMTILEDTTMCIAITGTEEIENNETYVEFIETYYYTPIIGDIKNFLKTEARKDIEEKRKIEDEAIEKQIEEYTNIIL